MNKVRWFIPLKSTGILDAKEKLKSVVSNYHGDITCTMKTQVGFLVKSIRILHKKTKQSQLVSNIHWDITCKLKWEFGTIITLYAQSETMPYNKNIFILALT